MKPVPHDDNLLVPKPPEKWSLDEIDKDAAMYQPNMDSDNDSDIELCIEHS